MDLLDQVHVLILGTPELNTALLVGSHQTTAVKSPPSSAAQAALDGAQDTFGFLGCGCTWPGHVQLLSHQHVQVLLRAALHSLQLVFVLGVALTQVQVLAVFVVELHIHTGPPPKLVQVPLWASLPSSVLTAPCSLVSLQAC